MKRSTILKYLPALVFAILTLSTCKKNNSAANILVGQWRQINVGNNPVYVIISQDKTFTRLSATSTGAHSYNKYPYEIESNAVLINNVLYQCSKSGDTLKLLQDIGNPGSSSNIVLVMDASTPTLDAWMPLVVYGSSLPWPNLNMDALTILGNNLWTTYQYDAIARSYNVSSSLYGGDITTSNNVSGIEAAGTDLWMYDETQRKLIKVNPVTKTVTFTSPAVPNGSGNPTLLAYDGANSLWCQSYSKVDVYNIATNSFNSYQMPDNYHDLAFGGGYLYAISYSNIYKIDPATLSILKTYRFPDGDGSQVIASAGGSDFWVYLDDKLQAPGRFQKITLN
ncbi:MAG: hypothetical protein JST83_18695 [Bacteroidetes bacterium]|nr:hypothetical protein [Bacteroidota bacterium]